MEIIRFVSKEYSENGYENDEGRIRIVKVSWKDNELTLLNTPIVTIREDIVRDRVPEILPDVELRERPVGNSPELIR